MKAVKYREPVCHESVSRKGQVQPCDRPAIGMRVDPDTSATPSVYPVCVGHARHSMVPIADTLDVWAERDALRAAVQRARDEGRREMERLEAKGLGWGDPMIGNLFGGMKIILDALGDPR